MHICKYIYIYMHTPSKIDTHTYGNVIFVYMHTPSKIDTHTYGNVIFVYFRAAFVGHDSAHNGITHHRNTDIMIGMVVGPLLTGISTAWWKRSHNAHHVVCVCVCVCFLFFFVLTSPPPRGGRGHTLRIMCL